MANYVFAYSGGKGVAAGEAERTAAMGTAKTGGSVIEGGSRALTGYSIVSADSLDQAVGI